MIIDDLPKQNFGEPKLPADFFENQFQSILGKTLELENWNIAGTRNIESCFPVPEGYWPGMEDGIRTRINPVPKTRLVFSRKWQLATVATTIIIFASSIFYFQNAMNQNKDTWSAKLDTASNEELMASVDLDKSEVQDLTLLMVVKSLPDSDLNFFFGKLNTKEIEDALDESTLIENFNDLDFN